MGRPAVSLPEHFSDGDRQALVTELSDMKDKLQAISQWLPGSDLRVRRLLLDARDKLSAASWAALRM
jgi:hypothetical protein